MKHSAKIVILLLFMFLLTQIIGIAVANIYFAANDNIPYGMSPPKDLKPATSLVSIILAIVFAVLLMFLLMKLRIEWFLRLWFFFVITIAISITINAFFLASNLAAISLNFVLFSMPLSSFIALIVALTLAFLKIFKRNILVHNFTELLIYPGVAAIFIPLLSLWTVVLLLILISIYDIYAVWHSGFMQKMAKYQIQTLKLFSGFFIPYIGKKERELLASHQSKTFKSKLKKIKVSIAILGGGDVVFPIILAGVVLRQFGLFSALIISICATFALAYLFYISKKGKFYPAMPFISAGCFVGLAISYVFGLLV